MAAVKGVREIEQVSRSKFGQIIRDKSLIISRTKYIFFLHPMSPKLLPVETRTITLIKFTKKLREVIIKFMVV